MPDAVESMAYNAKNGVPWHEKGTALPDVSTADEMYEASGLNWTVSKQPLFTYGLGAASTALLPVGGRMAMVRSSDNRVLGTVGETYSPIQNREMFDFAEALMRTGETVKFETAGSLNDGRTVFAEAVVPERGITIEGDPQGEIKPYLIISTGHDALRAFSATFTPVRVVCANTLAMALSGASNVFVVRHTVKAQDRIAQAYKTLRLQVEYLHEVKAVSEELIKRPMTKKDVLKGLEVLIPSMAETPEKAVKADKQRGEIFALYQNSDNLDGVPESAYRFVQAIAEFADHHREYRKTKKGSAEDARILAILDGTAADMKTRALGLVLPKAAKRGAGGRFVKQS